MDVAEAVDRTAAKWYCVIPPCGICAWNTASIPARRRHGCANTLGRLPCPEPVAYIDGLTMTMTWN